MDYSTSYFPLIVLGYPLDSKRSYGPLSDILCPGAWLFLPLGSRGQMPIKIGSFQFLPTGIHGLCFGCSFSGPLPLRSLTNGPLFKVRFGESLVVRLYSEIGHIHLSIEAQCVTTLLPLGDCHNKLYRSWQILKCHIPRTKCTSMLQLNISCHIGFWGLFWT